jgi:hypothetical protein
MGGRYFARWQPKCIKSEAVRTQECSRTIQCTLLPGHHVCFAYVKHSTLTCEMRVYDVMYIDSELILCLHDTSVTSEAVRTQECSRTIQCTLLPGHHVCFVHVKHSTLTCAMHVYDVMYIDSELILCLHDTSVTSEAVRTQECSRTIQCTLLPGHHVCFVHVKHSALTCAMHVYDVEYIVS